MLSLEALFDFMAIIWGIKVYERNESESLNNATGQKTRTSHHINIQNIT
jgi:hypothetical protein